MTLSASAQTLSERQLLLCACASLEAQGDLERLEPAISKALDGGVTVGELKEAFSQLYAYTGFPRSLNALGVLNKVLENNRKPFWQEGKPWTRPAIWDDAEQALRQGTQVQERLTGRPFNYDFCPQDDYYLKSHLFGDIFAGDGLSAADRELVTVAALSGLKGVEPQLAAHKAGAVNMGNTKEQVEGLCEWLSDNGFSQVDCAADANAGAWPKGQPNMGYARYFIGDSHLAPIRPANLTAGEASVANYANVTFEPGCRNNWHIHYGAHQILICVSGSGWYQEWGKPAIALTPGMIIDIPDEVKHWHGARKDSWFQHLTTHIATGGEQSNEWLEPVTDEVYDKL
ncbi:MAG: carboxymuconolactone decarboxylase family protein [Bacteroidales bacterium]|nr:carboxymuconolactone decarboxylase family protein [Bacteroidales bacterium]